MIFLLDISQSDNVANFDPLAVSSKPSIDSASNNISVSNTQISKMSDKPKRPDPRKQQHDGKQHSTVISDIESPGPSEKIASAGSIRVAPNNDHSTASSERADSGRIGDGGGDDEESETERNAAEGDGQPNKGNDDNEPEALPFTTLDVNIKGTVRTVVYFDHVKAMIVSL